MHDSKVDSAFHPSEVEQMSTGNSWGLSGDFVVVSYSLETFEPHPLKKDP